MSERDLPFRMAPLFLTGGAMGLLFALAGVPGAGVPAAVGLLIGGMLLPFETRGARGQAATADGQAQWRVMAFAGLVLFAAWLVPRDAQPGPILVLAALGLGAFWLAARMGWLPRAAGRAPLQRTASFAGWTSAFLIYVFVANVAFFAPADIASPLEERAP